ncbi:EamA family transporter [Chitinibacter tainanensis]|uniref:EamA family transporter n=1 Tax=Chitinibacter tainanensis TaxID=230667 RepID=UPI002352F21B|nr:EamA family transporter [Chitinibacter tainanensis]
MRWRDYLLALVVVSSWGFNFVVIRWGLHGLPPMLLGALRFLLVAVPAVFFIPRPALAARYWLAYGVVWGVGQFGFLFTAMQVGMPAGLASVVLQSQAFFTLLFAALWLGERWRWFQLAGLLVAAGGLTLIGLSHGVGLGAMSLLGFSLTLCGAAAWALGNILIRQLSRQGIAFQASHFLIWAAIPPIIIFSLLSLWLDGPTAIATAIRDISLRSILAVLYLAWVATILATSIWNRLLQDYSANQVAPFSLLVPWFGLASAALLLDEALLPQQWLGAAILMLGLLLNVFGGRLAGLPTLGRGLANKLGWAPRQG